MKKIESEDIANWSIRKLAAHCIFPRLSANEYYADTDYQQNIHLLVKEGVGGFCVFGGNMGIVRSMVNVLQSMAKTPLIFCADYEFGLPMRLENGTAFPHAMALGKTGDTEHTYNSAKTIAFEAKSIGINWNLAPVCDVNSNRNNPIINIRAFAADVDTVISHSEAYMNGLHSEKILSCAKHFPGHGDTAVDSHKALPVLAHTNKQIEEIELRPFIHAIQSDVKSIMVGHLAVPALDNDETPASLSYKIITELLRKKLGYDGLILSDALDMKAITDNYSNGGAAIRCLNAGNNILLMPPEPFELLKVLEASAKVIIDIHQRLIESTKRLLKAKEWCGLFEKKSKPVEINEIPFAQHEKIALAAAFAALEIKGNKSILPIKENIQIGGFAFLQTEEIDMPSMFFKILAQAIENDCDFAFIDSSIVEKDLFALNYGVRNADIMIFAFFFKPSAYKELKLSNAILDAYKRLSEGKPTIAILFGNPYLIDEIEADVVISAFSDSLPSVAATILKLSGREAVLE